MLTLQQLIARQAQQRPEAIFLRWDSETMRYRELRARVAQAAAALRDKGIAPEDRVLLMMGNHPEHVVLYLALACIGAVNIELSTHFKSSGVQLQLEDAAASFFIIDPEFAAPVSTALNGQVDANPRVLVLHSQRAGRHEFEALSLDGVARGENEFMATLDRVQAISYTSGTTGRPKGVILTERYFQVGAKNAALLADVRCDDVLFLWEPFYHIAGWMTVVMALQYGVSIALVERFSGSKCWDQIRQMGATKLHYLGSALNILLKQPPRSGEQDNPIRIAWGGASPTHIWREFEKRFGVTVREGYGISEAQNFTHLNLEGRVGSIGKPVEEFESWIAGEDGSRLGPLQVGEIVVRPKVPGVVMQGYLHAPQETAAVLKDGCVYTGDLGYQDEDGFFYYSGRKKDSLRRRGENVSAWEVERVINAHPAVEGSAVIGVTSEMGEQDIRAFVKLAPGKQLKPIDLIRWCERDLAHYQIPRYLDFVEEFPRGPTERILKSELPTSLSGSWDLEKSLHERDRRSDGKPDAREVAGDFLTELADGVLIIRLNRPKQYNAWTTAMRESMCDVLEDAADRQDVRAVVFTGAGDKAFCAGQDLAEAERFGAASHTQDWLGRLKRFYDVMRALPKPVVGALNGVAAGSGFQLALLMDVVVAHPGVKMGQPEVNSGIPSILGPWFMKESLGRSRTVELALTGRMMDAEEACRLGLIHHLVRPEQVAETAVAIARELGAKPPHALRITKDHLRLANASEYERAWEMTAAGQIEAFQTGEPQRVIRKFFEMRRARKTQD